MTTELGHMSHSCDVQVNASAAWHGSFMIVKWKIWMWMEEGRTSSCSRTPETGPCKHTVESAYMVLTLHSWKGQNLTAAADISGRTNESNLFFDVFLLLLTASFCCLGSMNVVSPDQHGKKLQCSVRLAERTQQISRLAECSAVMKHVWGHPQNLFLVCFREGEHGFSWPAW